MRGHLIVSERELFEVAERGDAHDLRDLVVREHQAVQLSQSSDSLRFRAEDLGFGVQNSVFLVEG